MTPVRSCVARPSIGTGDTVAQGSLHCKEHRELQMPRPQCTQVAPPEAGAQRSVAPSTSVDSPCSSSCSNSAEDSCKSGRSGRVDLKNRTEKRRNRHVWMNCRVIRDREAPGSNPGPPTNPVRSRAVVAVGRYDTGVSDDLPRRWLEYQRTSREEMFDAWIQVDRAVREDPKEGWRLVLELVRLAAADPVALGSIGAGPLEDLVRFHPNPFLDIAEAEARRNPPLADALRGTRYPGHGR